MRMQWWTRRHDGALALAVAVVVLAGALLAPAPPDAATLALPLVAAFALAARRRAPVVVLLVTKGCVLGYDLLGHPVVFAGLPFLIATYTAVKAGHRLLASAVVVVSLVLSGVALSVLVATGASTREIVESRLLIAGWLVASGVMGEVSRQRQAYVREVERRALEAERTRDEVARRRAGEERLRIARDLHDSLTHSISVIKVQAGVAVHLARKRGEQVPPALLAIQEATGDAVRELRTTLDVLRDVDDRGVDGVEGGGGGDAGGGGGGDGNGNGLHRLDELVERAVAAGLPATVAVRGEPRPLPAEVDAAAYRIVQEALTNVARHAGPTSAAVIRISYGDDGVTVQVDDDGRATPTMAPVAGVGLSGMRERVAALGGRLRAEPRREGGFRVHAELPIGEAP